MSVLHFFPDPLPGAAEEVRLVLGGHDVAGDGRAAGRELVQYGGLQVAEDGHGDRTGNGGGRHDQQVGRLLALGAEGVALLDPEAVLFVDDDQAQVVEPDLVLDQGVGADHDAGLAGDEVEERLAACRDAHRTGEQHHLRALLGAAEHAALGQLPHHFRDRAVVLLGEHLGGREHGGLPARVDDPEHGAQRDHGLAGTDLSLEEPVHRVLGREVVEDLPGDLLLALGEGEGQFGVEGVEQSAGRGSAGHGRELGVGVPAAGQRDLEDEGLVPLQPVPGLRDVRLGLRPVDLQQRLRERGESTALAQRRMGSGSTASCALGSTVSTALAIRHESSCLQAG